MIFRWMTGICPLFLSVLAVAMLGMGCGAAPVSDDDIPDDDDSTAADDDDDSGDDDTGGDDDTSGDDDTTPPPAPDCNVQSVVDASCAVVTLPQPPSISVGMSSCPSGDYLFEDSISWVLFLGNCNVITSDDPLAGHDWSLEAMIVTIRQGNACFPLSSVLWFAECNDGHHFGHAFDLCGECDTTQLVVNFVAIPAGRTPVQFHECLPDDLVCP